MGSKKTRSNIENLQTQIQNLKCQNIFPPTDHEFEEYCTTMLLDQLPDGTPAKNEKYYLLSDILPQDYELRKNLRTKRLESILAQHQHERTDRSFTKECLYCRDVITGLRSDYLEHLFQKHFLQLGRPENLVFVDELIDIVQHNLEILKCLYCEKIFKDRSTLKEHMRKKGHKKINPNIQLYDKFFLVNYKNEKAKHVKTMSSKDEEKEDEKLEPSSDQDEDWSDWDEETVQLTCLFCKTKSSDFSSLKEHMLSDHEVDFDESTKDLTFYQKIKTVNYVRRQIHILQCVTCDEKFECFENLSEHMNVESHFGIGEKKQWDKAEFFFPTYEVDGVLCLLDDPNEKDEVLIIPEDNSMERNKDAESLSLESFKL